MPLCVRIHVTSFESTSAITNWRSSSDEVGDRHDRRSAACRRPCAASRRCRAASPGRPRRERRRRQQAVQLASRAPCGRRPGRTASSSNTPSLRIGGCCTWPTQRGAGRGRGPASSVVSMRLASRMCSRDDSGSASMPTRPSRPDDVALDLVADDLDVAGVGRGLERADDVDRHARRRARRVDGEVDAVVAARLMRSRRDAPAGQAVLPGAAPAAAANSSGSSPAFCASPSLIHGRKSAGARSGNVRQRLVRSPLGSISRRARRRSAPPR